MGQPGEEEDLTPEERVWLEAHPHIKKRLDMMGYFLYLMVVGHTAETAAYYVRKKYGQG